MELLQVVIPWAANPFQKCSFLLRKVDKKDHKGSKRIKTDQKGVACSLDSISKGRFNLNLKAFAKRHSPEVFEGMLHAPRKPGCCSQSPVLDGIAPAEFARTDQEWLLDPSPVLSLDHTN